MKRTVRKNQNKKENENPTQIRNHDLKENKLILVDVDLEGNFTSGKFILFCHDYAVVDKECK